MFKHLTKKIKSAVKKISKVFFKEFVIYCCNSYCKKVHCIWQTIKKFIVCLMQESLTTYFVRCFTLNSSSLTKSCSVKRREMSANNKFNVFFIPSSKSIFVPFDRMLLTALFQEDSLSFLYCVQERSIQALPHCKSSALKFF